ncbi:hypothetical protein HELRODRAFT_173957 [Helobdella robusta]|uniref:Uncharacterized protein n=1 Tax=Helobdella robusta TaxID=6412 RepID=T1F7F0_HELRO|nr:hypothetical protein HELRODRAFT_173957 [Helobdella robusta]ESO03077.1 hypothetical protein HELRODRAFT_173957 [Helobdella robusta]
MYVEEDLLIVDEVGVSSQQAGREQTSAQPVFSDPERVYCRVADPGQERLRRSEGSGGYLYADAVRDRVVAEFECRLSKIYRNFVTCFSDWYKRKLNGTEIAKTVMGSYSSRVSYCKGRKSS